MTTLDQAAKKRRKKKPNWNEDLLPKMVDLEQQAREEKSHHYVASILREAMMELTHLQTQLFLAHAVFNKFVSCKANKLPAKYWPDMVMKEVKEIEEVISK